MLALLPTEGLALGFSSQSRQQSFDKAHCISFSQLGSVLKAVLTVCVLACPSGAPWELSCRLSWGSVRQQPTTASEAPLAGEHSPLWLLRNGAADPLVHLVPAASSGGAL